MIQFSLKTINLFEKGMEPVQSPDHTPDLCFNKLIQHVQ